MKAHVSNVFTFINTNVSSIILKANNGLTDFGVFTKAYTIVQQIWILPDAVSMVIMSRIAAMTDTKDKTKLATLSCKLGTYIKMCIRDRNARSLSWYSEELGDWYAASGLYELLLAHSSRDVRASVPLHFAASKRLPLRIHRNTTIGALLTDPRTEPVLRRVLNKGKMCIRDRNCEVLP